MGRALRAGRRVWALEGTGSFAAGLVTVLAEAGEDVVEIQNNKRSHGAKNDRIDAVQAAEPRSPNPNRPLRVTADSGRHFGRY